MYLEQLLLYHIFKRSVRSIDVWQQDGLVFANGCGFVCWS